MRRIGLAYLAVAALWICPGPPARPEAVYAGRTTSQWATEATQWEPVSSMFDPEFLFLAWKRPEPSWRT
jgi:hypothetical protein